MFEAGLLSEAKLPITKEELPLPTKKGAEPVEVKEIVTPPLHET